MFSRVSVATAFSAMVCMAAFAESAANAYVTINAAKARTAGGLDFATGGPDPVVVTVTAQPGWVLTSPSTLTIPEGTAGIWSARSFYGESGAGGEICIPRSTSSTNHVAAPKLDIKLHVDQGNGKGTVAGKPGDDRERGGIVNIHASANGIVAGRHQVVTIHESCPGGKSNVRTKTSAEIAVRPDDYLWEWSVGDQSGSARGESLAVTGVRLPHGKYTVSVTLTVSCSSCPACRASATETKSVNIGNGVIK